MLAADVVDRPIGVVIGRVALSFPLFAVEGQNLIDVVIAGVLRMGGTIPNDLVVPIAAETGVGACMPLADLRGLVALPTEFRRPERALLRIVLAAWIAPLHGHRLDSVLQMASEQAGT